MKVYAVQLDSLWEAPETNMETVERLLAAIPLAPGSLIVLPEMFSTGFSLDLAKTVQGMARETDEFIRRIAMRHRCTVLGGVVSAGRDGRGLNEAVAFGPTGRLFDRYVKQRPFSGAGEDAVHEAGKDTVVFPVGAFKAAPLICYDLRFPELFRAAVRRGADLFVVIAAWPVARVEHWLTLLRARAIENQAFVVGVNRCGNEPRFVYPGRSVVVNPQGVIIADAGELETVLVADIEQAEVQAWRDEFPALRDARWEE
jgi:predicted amidohydrolase